MARIPLGDGRGLARFLRWNDHTVQESTHRPATANADCPAERHDRRRARRPTSLAGRSTAVPKTGDGAIESLRLLKTPRDTAVKARSSSRMIAQATLVTARNQLRSELEPLTNHKFISACAALRSRA